MQGNIACLFFLYFWLTAVFGLGPALIALLNEVLSCFWGSYWGISLFSLTCALSLSPLFFVFCFVLFFLLCLCPYCSRKKLTDFSAQKWEELQERFEKGTE